MSYLLKIIWNAFVNLILRDRTYWRISHLVVAWRNIPDANTKSEVFERSGMIFVSSIWCINVQLYLLICLRCDRWGECSTIKYGFHSLLINLYTYYCVCSFLCPSACSIVNPSPFFICPSVYSLSNHHPILSIH